MTLNRKTLWNRAHAWCSHPGTLGARYNNHFQHGIGCKKEFCQSRKGGDFFYLWNKFSDLRAAE
jgi:hypothetical protein